MTVQDNYDPAYKDLLLDTLRREILAARLKVTLDKKLGEKTSETVKRLANMTLPPLVYGRSGARPSTASSARTEEETDSDVSVVGSFSRLPHIKIPVIFVPRPRETASQEAHYRY